jgi:uncharacterized lipoprotein YddW (UPF0748 family)
MTRHASQPPAGPWRTRLLFGFLLLFRVLPLLAVEELRGLWVDTFHPGLRNAREIDELVKEARTAGFNALFVEVRRRGDTWYDSSFEPRVPESHPEFDPLQHLLTLAHDTNQGPRLEIHAWTVAFNIWNSTNSRPDSPDHPFLRHSEWLTRTASGRIWDGANFAFDPGHPEVQEYTFHVLMDLVRRYDLDGLHLDYIRYADRDQGYHPEAIRRFNEGKGRKGRPMPTDPDWLQFRRDQITAIVRKIYLTCLEERPALKVSAATITFAPGITRTPDWPSSSAYRGVLQDWRAWMEEGILDWNIPMAYFRQTEYPDAMAAWSTFIKDHQYRRRAAIGLGTYLNTPSNITAQIRLAKRPSPAGNEAIGVVVYSYATPSLDTSRTATFHALRNPSRFDAHPIPVFSAPATVPPVPWKSSRQFGHLKGFVRNSRTETAIDGARIVLTGPVQRTLQSDATGFFGTVDLPPGDYRLAVSAPGFDALNTDANLRGATVTHLDLPLESPSATSPPSPRPADPTPKP